MAADGTPDGGLSGREVVFRLDRGFRRPLVTRGSTALAVAVVAAVIAVLGVIPAFTWGVAGALGAVALCYAARYVWVGRFRTRLSPQGIEIRGYFDHFVPWTDVTDVEVTGVEATGVILLGPGGRGGLSISEDDPSGPPAQGLERQLADTNDESGFRAKLATVRVARAHGHRLLLRAPLVTAWQSDPQFADKAQTVRRWWQAYGQPAPR
jgi:hypothetical protein